MKRRIHAYCVGTPRSGTASMAGIFSSCYRARHEPYEKEYLTIIYALQKGLISKEYFRRRVIYLDNNLQLEFNSSYLNSWLLDVLVIEFPSAKFIFTIRDCYSWLNSFINLLLGPYRPTTHGQNNFLNMAMGKKTHRYAKEEKILYENGLYTLDGFLSYWAKINNEILATVPKSRIMVVKTHEIITKMNEIADFLNIPLKTIDLTKSHSNKSMRDFDILSKIDKDYLSSKVNLHCKVLMDEFFPGFLPFKV